MHSVFGVGVWSLFTNCCCFTQKLFVYLLCCVFLSMFLLDYYFITIFSFIAGGSCWYAAGCCIAPVCCKLSPLNICVSNIHIQYWRPTVWFILVLWCGSYGSSNFVSSLKQGLLDITNMLTLLCCCVYILYVMCFCHFMKKIIIIVIIIMYSWQCTWCPALCRIKLWLTSYFSEDLLISLCKTFLIKKHYSFKEKKRKYKEGEQKMKNHYR